MGLFSVINKMAAPEEPADDRTRLAELERKLATQEEEARLRAKYGANLNDEQLAFYRGVEAKAAALKAKRAEQERNRYAEYKARDAAYRKLAGELATSGRLRLYLNGKPEKLGAGCLISCPACHVDVAFWTNKIIGFAAERLGIGYASPQISDPDLWDEKILKSFINPRATPGHMTIEKCPHCHTPTRLMFVLIPGA